MTLRHYIFPLIALLSACSDEPLPGGADVAANREALIEQGRYLTARSAETPAVTGTYDLLDRSTWFPVGTLYRLLAYTKDYNDQTPDDATRAEICRFNKVAWEGENGGLRFINVTETPDKWFGFSPLAGESSSLKSIDFYGFTYGKAVDPRVTDYIELDDIEEEALPGKALDLLKRTETVGADGKLPDLMRGELHNQNIQTAGRDAAANAQSVLPFRHCFSRLHFMAVQQPADNVAEPLYKGLEIVGVDVINTYTSASVYLKDGAVEVLGTAGPRALAFTDADRDGDGERDPINTLVVDTVQRELGEMIVVPSYGGALKNENLTADGYAVGLKLRVKCPTAEIRQKFINVDKTIEYDAADDAEGAYYMTVTKPTITNNLTNSTLYLRPNTGYTIVFSFQEDAVRIITVIPLVEEWIQGEVNPTDPNDPWDDQPMGQPQMFDNVVWSDRNNGAAHYDPISEEFEYSMGYFYQAGRNIPYYPFNINEHRGTDYPTIDDMKGLRHYDDHSTRWSQSEYRFFPVVDDSLLVDNGTWRVTPNNASDWCINATGTAQMSIPETPPTDKYFGFMRENKLAQTEDMDWNASRYNQPVSGAWRLPTSDQFMSIFPTTPHAGNLSLKNGGNNNYPMNWGDWGDTITAVKALRVTVPYYIAGDTSHVERTENYDKAWRTLKDHNDPGTTHTDLYTLGGPIAAIEPEGDPEGGYASIYVISKKADSIVYLPEPYRSRKADFFTTEWGTIYGIKRVYTPEAYRMRWRALIAQDTGSQSPGIVVEVCRYRCSSTDTFDEDTYMNYDWDHPVARLLFPVAGLGDHTGEYINFGTECMYATSDPIRYDSTQKFYTTGAVQMKITGNNTANTYIAVVKNCINRHFGMQIRPVWGGVQ